MSGSNTALRYTGLFLAGFAPGFLYARTGGLGGLDELAEHTKEATAAVAPTALLSSVGLR